MSGKAVVEAVLADVTGIVAVRGISKSSASQSLAQTQSLYVIATSSDGRAIRVDVGKALSSQSTGGRSIRGDVTNSEEGDRKAAVKDLFYYHTASVWGVSAERRQGGTLVATVGEDKQLCVWDTDGHYLTCRFLCFAYASLCTVFNITAWGISFYSTYMTYLMRRDLLFWWRYFYT